MRREEQSFVRVSGGIITSHFVSLMEDEDHGFAYARPETFVSPWEEEDAAPQDGKEFLKGVREVWDDLRGRFDEKYRDVHTGRVNADDARRLWQRPVLKALGFDPVSTNRQIVISDRLKYRFSHRGWFARQGIARPPVIQILSPGTDPDARPARGAPSPQDALQDCLNRHDATWAMLMNETVIRILRDYHHTTVPGYVEFDLEGIFLNRSFPEFLALYRFCHASRFARSPAGGKEPLEEYYEVSRQAGEKIGERLRENVVLAIEKLGNGFLDGALIERLRGDDAACREYYREILAVVYRIIFMLFAEQRGLLGGGEHGNLFLEEYSITSLRERVDAFAGRDDRHTDLWEGLCVTFRMLEEGVPELGVNAFDGVLFSRENERFLKDVRCRNTALMEAIRALTWTVPESGGRGRRQGVYGRQRISYADLSVEEIGAIYESLLDYMPRITVGFEEVEGREYRPGEFMLDPRGSERKTTGSYYTNPDLIAELVKSALDPVIADRLSRAGPDPAVRERALLSIRVCDPACGSGAFLIAAANRLGRELAKVRSGTELPSAAEVHAARRDVLSHCIYGVDLNPMAVELAKVSLWIDSLVADRPLSFLDHHIKCGNSLVGATPAMIVGGVPDGAYAPAEGESKDVAKEAKKANREQRTNTTFAQFSESPGILEACARRFAALAETPEDDPAAVARKREAYERLVGSERVSRDRLAADCWCAAFFWPLDAEHAMTVPTTETVRMAFAHGEAGLDPATLAGVEAIAARHRFFHWHIAFPEVFADGGFDCVLGNPPWDKIQENSDEFFSEYDETFRSLSARDKKLRIVEICQDHDINKRWHEYKKNFDYYTIYYNNANYYYQGQGHLNAFKLFLEKYFKLTKNEGYFGIIVQSSISNDKGCTDLRKLLFEKTDLKFLFVFENKKGIFQIHRSKKFALLAAQKGKNTHIFQTAFMLHDVEEIHSNAVLKLSVDLIERFAPNTLSILEFSNQSEINLIEKIFSNHPLLGEKLGNSWNVIFHRELNVTDDREILQTKVADFPVFEGKMIHHYSHQYEVPQFWLKNEDCTQFYSRMNYPAWKYYRLGYRAVASSTNETSLICTIIPKGTATVNSLRTIELFEKNPDTAQLVPMINDQEQLYLASLFNSMIINYIIRKKVSENISAFYMYQLPVPRLRSGDWYFDQIIPRAARLICTTQEFVDLWNEVYLPEWNNLSKTSGGTSDLEDWNKLQPIWTEYSGITNGWDQNKHDGADRAQLRCEIDALVAHLYGLERSELEYILSTFPAIKQNTPWIIEGILKEFDEIKVFLQKLISNVTIKSTMDIKGQLDWAALIRGGENEQVEFKTSMSWDRATGKRNKALEHAIARTLASFMNTRGGVLFIGVDDAGEIVGLDGDIAIAKRQNEDGLRLRFDDLVRTYLGNALLPQVTVHSLDGDGKRYWAVEVRPADDPVYVTNNGDDEFWVRGTASSRKLSVRETVEYIKSRSGAPSTERGE